MVKKDNNAPTPPNAALDDLIREFQNGRKGSRAASHDFNQPWEDYTEIPDTIIESVIAALRNTETNK